HRRVQQRLEPLQVRRAAHHGDQLGGRERVLRRHGCPHPPGADEPGDGPPGAEGRRRRLKVGSRVLRVLSKGPRANGAPSFLLMAVLAGTAAIASDAGARASVLPTLYVNYTMNCTFSISDDSGRTIGSIAPGEYQVLVLTPMVFADVDLSGKPANDMTACKSFVQFQLTG